MTNDETAMNALRAACEAEQAVRNHKSGNTERLEKEALAKRTRATAYAALTAAGVDASIVWRVLI